MLHRGEKDEMSAPGGETFACIYLMRRRPKRLRMNIAPAPGAIEANGIKEIGIMLRARSARVELQAIPVLGSIRQYRLESTHRFSHDQLVDDIK
jgi:hypothetical protein